MKEVKVKELIGSELRNEDAIILKELIIENLQNKIVLDFQDTKTRDYVASNVIVKNLSTESNFKKVLLGTSMC